MNIIFYICLSVICGGFDTMKDFFKLKPLPVRATTSESKGFLNFMETKICKKCEIEKDLSFFKKAPTCVKGVYMWCKVCDAKHRREKRANNPEKYREIAKKEYYNNKEKRNASAKAWKEKNKERLIKWGENYRNLNRDKYNKLAQANREKHREAYNLRAKEKRKDPLEKLKWRVRLNISRAFKSKRFTKNGTTEKYLGCDYNFFIQYIESQFKKGMTWDNIHLDHIKPMASAKTEKEVIELNHYTNFQPLFISENIAKGAKLITKQLRLL